MNAFINENGILVSFGFMGSDNDNTLIPLPDDFSMTPGLAQYINGDWVEYLPSVDYKSIHQPIKDQLMDAAMETTQG
ncbi:hypothetical protein I5L59_09785 [Pseudomonas moraviensis]|jgi:hypothetical protein|uniref:hypothetical protein n=1 Tax=Pseudomonas TaxID=286 RepID=UPI0018DA3227|nr:MULTISPECIES: hypothetical protein [Pseudomonas]MBH3443865.1 hypothetical protein [Pseudomonas moraviensis]GLH20973.1 hypothetical protein BR1R3_37150 [Pseudomonas atacamensis]